MTQLARPRLAVAPDGKRFGLVRSARAPSGLAFLWAGDEPPGTLLLYTSAGLTVSERIDNIRHFAGWDRTGRRLAYVRAEALSPNDAWLYLLPAEERARDVLMVRVEGEPDRPTGLSPPGPQHRFDAALLGDRAGDAAVRRAAQQPER